MNKQIFVISMINSLKRRDYISKLFKESNISFTFLNAFDGFESSQKIGV